MICSSSYSVSSYLEDWKINVPLIAYSMFLQIVVSYLFEAEHWYVIFELVSARLLETPPHIHDFFLFKSVVKGEVHRHMNLHHACSLFYLQKDQTFSVWNITCCWYKSVFLFSVRVHYLPHGLFITNLHLITQLLCQPLLVCAVQILDQKLSWDICFEESQQKRALAVYQLSMGVQPELSHIS